MLKEPQFDECVKVKTLKGAMVALVTPLDDRGQLDEEGLHRLLDHVLAYSLTGVCPAGSTGEGPLLSRQVRARLATVVSERVPNNVWNIPAVVATTITEVSEDLSAYADAGADAVLVTTPFYYQLGSDAVTQWFEAVVSHSPLPVLLYNIPALTKINIPPDVVRELARDERVIGMKDSSRDMEYFERVLAVTRKTSFSVFTGSDTLLTGSCLLGGTGTIAASANLVPEIVSLLWSAVQAEDWSKAGDLQLQLLKIVDICRKFGFPVCWKAALHLLGVCSSHPAFPLVSLTAPMLRQFAKDLVEVGMTV